VEFISAVKYVVSVSWVQSQFPEVNDAELKEMEAHIADMTQKVKDSQEAQRRLDAGSLVSHKIRLKATHGTE